MRFVAHHVLAFVVIGAALLATAGVFAFARPEYRPPYESRTLGVSQQRIYGVAAVRRAFAAHGVHLLYSTQFGPRISGVTMLFSRRPASATDVNVTVAGPQAKVSWGPKLDRYDERFGNVAVRYDGGDPSVLAAIEAAVSDLR